MASPVDPRFKTRYVEDDQLEAVKSTAGAQRLSDCRSTSQFPQTSRVDRGAEAATSGPPAKTQKTPGSFFQQVLLCSHIWSYGWAGCWGSTISHPSLELASWQRGISVFLPPAHHWTVLSVQLPILSCKKPVACSMKFSSARESVGTVP